MGGGVKTAVFTPGKQNAVRGQIHTSKTKPRTSSKTSIKDAHRKDWSTPINGICICFTTGQEKSVKGGEKLYHLGGAWPPCCQ